MASESEEKRMHSAIHSTARKFSSGENSEIEDASSPAATAGKFSSAENSEIEDASSSAATAGKFSSAKNSEIGDASSPVATARKFSLAENSKIEDAPSPAATAGKFLSAENSENDADKSADSFKILESVDLSSTAEPADRQVFLCCRGSESDPIPNLLSAAFKARQEAMPIQTDLIICKEIYGSEFSDGNILILPERIKYRNLKESDIDSFVEHVLVNNQPLPSGIEEMMPDYHILVCADGSGTAVRDKFIEEAELRGLTVNPCSQTGGEKYTGSLIVYTADPDGSITGRWYGEVTPEDVEDLFNECFGFAVMNKEIREQLLRSMRSEDDAPYEDDSP